MIKIVFCTYIGKVLSSLKISSCEVHWGDNRSFVRKISNLFCLRFLCLIFVISAFDENASTAPSAWGIPWKIHKLSLVLLMESVGDISIWLFLSSSVFVLCYCSFLTMLIIWSMLIISVQISFLQFIIINLKSPIEIRIFINRDEWMFPRRWGGGRTLYAY